MRLRQTQKLHRDVVAPTDDGALCQSLEAQPARRPELDQRPQWSGLLRRSHVRRHCEPFSLASRPDRVHYVLEHECLCQGRSWARQPSWSLGASLQCCDGHLGLGRRHLGSNFAVGASTSWNRLVEWHCSCDQQSASIPDRLRL